MGEGLVAQELQSLEDISLKIKKEREERKTSPELCSSLSDSESR